MEAAYGLEADDAAWLLRLLRAARRELDQGLGVFGALFEVDAEERMTFGPRHGLGVERTVDALLAPLEAEAGASLALCPHGERRLLGSTEDLLRSRAITAAEGRARLGRMREHGIVDLRVLRIFEPAIGRGLLLAAPMPERGSTSATVLERWSRLAPHLSAGLRLRVRLRRGIEIGAGEGRGLPAEPISGIVRRQANAREALRQAVRDVEQVRAKREPPARALALWRGLVAGEWSLVDHFDEAGRRYVVARRTEEDAKDPRALTLRERQVSIYLSKGQSNKLIAYELGISLSTVAHHVRSIVSKLRVGSRVELVKLLRQLRVYRISAEADPDEPI